MISNEMLRMEQARAEAVRQNEIADAMAATEEIARQEALKVEKETKERDRLAAIEAERDEKKKKIGIGVRSMQRDSTCLSCNAAQLSETWSTIGVYGVKGYAYEPGIGVPAPSGWDPEKPTCTRDIREILSSVDYESGYGLTAKDHQCCLCWRNQKNGDYSNLCRYCRDRDPEGKDAVADAAAAALVMGSNNTPDVPAAERMKGLKRIAMREGIPFKDLQGKTEEEIRVIVQQATSKPP